MIAELKADLHLHTAEDPYDVVIPDASEVIDRAAQYGFEVIAITNHLTMIHSDYLEEYARERGILLIPGAEIEVGKRHVLLLNPTEEAAGARTFEELRVARRNSDRPMAVVAPHPFFPSFSALGNWVMNNADLFDAIEQTAYYFRGLNFNRKAEKTAKRLGLTLLGNSDAHYTWQFGRTYSMIRAEKTVEGVIGAVIDGRVRVVTGPLPFNKVTLRIGLRGLRIPEYLLWKEWREGDFYWDKVERDEIYSADKKR